MAKKTFGIFARQGVGQGLWWVITTFWPWSFPAVLGATQWLHAVPWPYFVTGLAITVCASLLSVKAIVDWRERKNIERKIVISLDKIFQGPSIDSDHDLRYHLEFSVYNGFDHAIFMRAKSATWSLDTLASKSIDITDAQGMMIPRHPTTLASPVIRTPLSEYSRLSGGQFEIVIQVGEEFNKPTKTIKQTGTYDVMGRTDKPVACYLDVGPKVTKLEFSDIKD